jgi:hypothetical protein
MVVKSRYRGVSLLKFGFKTICCHRWVLPTQEVLSIHNVIRMVLFVDPFILLVLLKRRMVSRLP